MIVILEKSYRILWLISVCAYNSKLNGSMCLIKCITMPTNVWTRDARLAATTQ